jgi:plasmid replication initiation protein
MAQKKRALTIKKHVDSVHIRGELSLLQRKLANALLYHAYPDLPVKETHEIKVEHLCDLIDYNSNDWATLQDALNGLMTTTLEWGVLTDSKSRWGASTLLAGAEIRNGLCHYAYSPFLREKLYSPEVYATINLDIQKKFGSKYGLALYENCVRYRNVGSTGWMALEVFRQLMGCDKQTYYDDFKQLNCLVIKPAVQEVNATSDIEVTPEYKRASRKVSSVRMKIADKRNLPPLKAGKAKRNPAEGSARVAAMIDEAEARKKAAENLAAAEQAFRDMKAVFKRGGGAA